MQGWVNEHPVWFVLSDILFLYLIVSLVVSWWSGWAVLAREFRLRNSFIGPRWHFQSAQMRWLCGYHNCLTIGANAEGLYLAPLPFFPLFHPPLFIPWTQVSFRKEKLFFLNGVRFELGRENGIALWLREPLVVRLEEAAGRSYPVASLG